MEEWVIEVIDIDGEHFMDSEWAYKLEEIEEVGGWTRREVREKILTEKKVGQKREVGSERCCQSCRRVSSPSSPSAVLVVELKAMRKCLSKCIIVKKGHPTLEKIFCERSLGM